MSESLLIQVDEVTKGMLETIEERIFEGTRTAQQSGLQQVSDLLEETEQSTQRSLETITKQSKQIQEQIEPLQGEVQRVGRQLQEANATAHSQVKQLHESLQRLVPEMEQRIVEHLGRSDTLLQQQAIQIESLVQLCTALSAKVDVLETEVKWFRKPIWKRLFGGRN